MVKQRAVKLILRTSFFIGIFDFEVERNLEFISAFNRNALISRSKVFSTGIEVKSVGVNSWQPLLFKRYVSMNAIRR